MLYKNVALELAAIEGEPLEKLKHHNPNPIREPMPSGGNDQVKFHEPLDFHPVHP